MFKKILWPLLLTLSTLWSFLSFFIFFHSYWSKDFNENGAAFDAIEGVVYKDNSFIWGVSGFMFILPIIFYLYKRITK